MPPLIRRVSQLTKSSPRPMGTASIQIMSVVEDSATASYSMCFDSSSGTSV